MKTTIILLAALLPCCAFADIIYPGTRQPVDLVPIELELSKISALMQVQAQIQATKDRQADEQEYNRQVAEYNQQWYLNRQRQLLLEQKQAEERERNRQVFFERERAVAMERAKLPPDPYKVQREEGTRKYWSTVKAGMTKEEVSRLIGGPNVIVGTRWIYSGTGTVVFGGEKVAEVR